MRYFLPPAPIAPAEGAFLASFSFFGLRFSLLERICPLAIGPSS
ncbi:hypothetical protein U91I_03676 [alpha proteobacterium U9-1i]|nr:hypothetical protein U91I_03676 [alpha proteobacterium U9-1i]